MTRLLKTPIIGRSAAVVDSSRSDMLAGLSKWEIFRMPPAFWANAAPATAITANSAPAVASTQRTRFIFHTPPVVLHGPIGPRRRLPAGPFYWALMQEAAPRRLAQIEWGCIPVKPNLAFSVGATWARPRVALRRAWRSLVVEPKVLKAR